MNSRGISKYGRGRKTRFDSPKPVRTQNFFGNMMTGMMNQPEGGLSQAPPNSDKSPQNHFLNATPAGGVNLWSENEDLYGEQSRDKPLVFSGPQSEDEPFVSEEFVTLDWYNSDLNLEIDRNHFCGGIPLSKLGFGYMWAGSRANYGVVRGKVCFEVQITSTNNVVHLNEPNPFALRLGWSIDESGFQLGEEGFSYGYDTSGMTVLSNKFEGYGRPFGLGDVIGCYLDLTSDPVNIGYTLNGEFLGVAFSVGQAQLSGRALFPHICSKNYGFTVNFGQLSQPLNAIIPGYIHLGQLELNDGLFPGTKAPKERRDCEILCLIGLPGSGKTFFAEDYKIKNPEKRFNIIGVSSILEKMSYNGCKISKAGGPEWEGIVRAVVDVLGALTTMASKRRRNYIFDQANVSPKVRQRKMMAFNGFQSKAIVIVPTNDVYLQRLAKYESKEVVNVPKHILLNMKANFILPEAIETYFNDVIYTELGPLEASRLVENYNNEAWRAGYIVNPHVEKFVQESVKYRQMNRINGPIGNIMNNMFFNETSRVYNVPEKSLDPRPLRNNNSTFPFNEGSNKGAGGSSSYSAAGGGGFSYPLQNKNNLVPKGSLKPNSRYSHATTVNNIQDEGGDIEIIKEMHFPRQVFRDSYSKATDNKNYVNDRQRSRSPVTRPRNNSHNPYIGGHGRKSESELSKDIHEKRMLDASSHQGYSRREYHRHQNDYPKFYRGYNNDSFNGPPENGYFMASSTNTFKGSSYNTPRKFAHTYDSSREEGFAKEFYPEEDRRGPRGNRFNFQEQTTSGYQFTSRPNNEPSSSSTGYNDHSQFNNRSKADKRSTPFPVPTVVAYPKSSIHQSVPPAPHIRPLSEVKVSSPSSSKMQQQQPLEGEVSYESPPPMVQGFRRHHGGGGGSRQPCPVPPVQQTPRYTGFRNNMPLNRNYSNISYPKY